MEKFWKTEEGKIIMHGIHEHAHGLQYINSALNIIKRTIESDEPIDLEELKKDLELIERGREKCKESIDYVYKKLKELKENNKESEI
jgi:hydrogenase maturation factor HypE